MVINQNHNLIKKTDEGNNFRITICIFGQKVLLILHQFTCRFKPPECKPTKHALLSTVDSFFYCCLTCCCPPCQVEPWGASVRAWRLWKELATRTSLASHSWVYDEEILKVKDAFSVSCTEVYDLKLWLQSRSNFFFPTQAQQINYNSVRCLFRFTDAKLWTILKVYFNCSTDHIR